MNLNQVISKMFSFPLLIEQYFTIDQKLEQEWKLIQSFCQQIINHKIYDDYERYYNINILPNQAVNQVFLEMNKINEIIGLVIKIRKDIIYTQFKEANTNDQSSMFNTYQSLQKYLNKQFEIKMHPYYQKYQLTNYGIFDLLVFNHLHKSRSFHRVIHKGVAPQISELFNWYEAFRNNFEIDELIDPNYLPRKEKRVQIQKITEQKSNPDLIETIRDDKFERFKELLSNGASLYTINLRERDKMMVPHLVCAYARMNFAEYLQTLNVDWECEDGDKMTPLFYAIRSESTQMIDFLLNQKVNLEHKDIQNRTPFYYACSLGFLHIIRYLTEKGANINARTALGRTPFSKSSFLGLYNVVEFLLQQPNIDYNYADKQGRNALHNAVFGPKGGRDGRKVGTWCYDSPLIAQMLLEHGMDVEAEDKDRNTPLHVSASSEALSSIPVLIAFGCDINRRNKWGETALMIAAKFNHHETAKLLVEYSCDYLIVNEGYTAMEVAAKNKQFEVFQYLLDVMKKELLQLQQINKYKLQNQLQSLMILTKDLNPNPFVRYFLEQFQPIYDDDHISLIIDMSDCQKELMISCLQNQNVTQQQILTSFELCLKRKKLEIFKQLCNHTKTEYTIPLQKTLITMMIEIQELNEIIFQYNIDWLNYRSKLGETFLHRLVEKRKTETLLLIINYFQDCIDGKNLNQYKNQLLKNLNKQQIYEFLVFQNLNSSSIIELAVIHKFMDIYQMLDHFISINFEQKEGLKFKIQEYSVEIDNDTKLPLIQIKEDQNYQFFKNITEIYQLSQKENQLFQQILQQFKQGKQKLSSFYQTYQQGKPVILIETKEQLCQCVKEIMDNYKIIGVDVEHYSDKIEDCKFSFACTIQISTIDKDFVIDIMKLRNDTEQHLNPIFQSQEIVKLFHGCDVDLRVLFSDLKIQVISILDTSRIDMALVKSHNASSLEKLCKVYLNIYLDKLYQTSDWRIRPLPHQMIEYARLDSSCLLFLYPILMDECRKQNIVTKVINQCQKLSLIQHYPLLKIINKN